MQECTAENRSTHRDILPHLAQCSGVEIGTLLRRRHRVISIHTSGGYPCSRVHTPAVPAAGTGGVVVGQGSSVNRQTDVGALDSGKGAILQALRYVDSVTIGHQPVIRVVIAHSLPRLVGLPKQSVKGRAVISSSGCW